MGNVARLGSAALAALLASSCGAKTGLLVPDASRPPDAGRDAGPDASDSGMCVPSPIALERRGAQVVFIVDRSNSMADDLQGDEPEPGEPSRWQVTAQVLEDVLVDADRLLEIGAKFYPRPLDDGTPEQACSVDPGIDLAPARDNVDDFLGVFATTGPSGGTPTAVALMEVRDFLERRPAPGIPRFVILATDGGPNCNPDGPVHHTECLCTGRPEDCLDATFGPYNCIDEMRTLEVIDELARGQNVPVYVIGIDDPTRPDLAAVLDRMAVAGGRPREEPDGRSFYSVRRPDDFRSALRTITESISRCVFTVQPAPSADALVEVTVGGVAIARDRSRSEGWDYTAATRSEITLFGGACDRVAGTGGPVAATVRCPDEE